MGFLGFRCGMMFSWPKQVTKYDLEADYFSYPYDDVNKRKLAYSHLGIGDKYPKTRGKEVSKGDEGGADSPARTPGRFSMGGRLQSLVTKLLQGDES
ncbi:uncharacterized protein [Lolium perenne]|uniref:uncharacterized protein isoform X2 n=1 Tax=Lolium perenne TaxID=4522 RepID=UPI0021F6492C|nr:uncharacterized protein LOC127348864 isoform X2 [Lolium perenne]